MISDPLVYLLLRTHNRQEEFQRCIESISEQSVIPEIIIISDDKNDNYINNVKLPHQVFRPLYKKPQWWIRHHNPFNDYFNQVLSLIPDGNFIYYLDDDDVLVDNNWIKTILEENADLLIGRFQLGESHKGIIIGEQIARGKIGGSCIAVRSDIARQFKWPSRSAGDFFFISQIINKYEPQFISMIAGKVQKDLQHSWGVRKNY
ncbi:uncharacterized protein METZ01_LOCUS148956 [marine metagenome]|uniref:Glycosyltransferase 2-like domain-containing protein n=1 Tax=marine metagenome TaxID=408172 RepID=A0A382A4N2_9ZZZZ